MTSPRYSIILSVNDLEARAIAEIGTERGHDVIDLGLDWGGRLDPLAPRLQDLQQGVILVETPHPAFEESLRAAGKVVHVVDHHLSVGSDGHLLDRRHPRSSLEQVGELLNHSVADERLRRISANDRGFIPSLAEMGLQEDDVLAVRQEDLNVRLRGTAESSYRAAFEWLQGAEAAGRLRVLETGRKGKAEDPRLILVHAPAEHEDCLLDALYAWHKERGGSFKDRLEVLALFDSSETPNANGGENATSPASLFFSGKADRFDLLRELLDTNPTSPTARLSLSAGGGDGGCFLGARDDLGTEGDALSTLADRMLNDLLTGNRPLISWRSHFLQVLTGPVILPAAGAGSFKPDCPTEEHRRYFLEHLRAHLVPNADGYTADGSGRDLRLRLRSYIWENPGLALGIEIPGEASPPTIVLRAPVLAVRIHVFLNETTVVEWECGGTTDVPPTGAENGKTYLWQQLLTGAWTSRNHAPGTLAQLLDFNWAARQVFSPYRNPDDSASITLENAEGAPLGVLGFGLCSSATEIDGWFKALIDVIKRQGIDLTGLRLAFDERARVVSGLASVGNAPATAAGKKAQQVILARLRGVDAYRPYHMYDAAFAERELGKGWYDRFAEYGTLYMASDHSFTMLAYGDYVLRFIMNEHLPQLYRRLFLIALVYSATLHVYARNMAELARQGLGVHRRQVRELREEFITFANGLWFDVISSQVQGRELFVEIRGWMAISQAYEELKADIDRTDELLEAINARLFSWIGAGGLVLAITTGFLGMNLFEKNSFDDARFMWFCIVLVGCLALLGAGWLALSGWPKVWWARIQKWSKDVFYGDRQM